MNEKKQKQTGNILIVLGLLFIVCGFILPFVFNSLPILNKRICRENIPLEIENIAQKIYSLKFSCELSPGKYIAEFNLKLYEMDLKNFFYNKTMPLLTIEVYAQGNKLANITVSEESSSAKALVPFSVSQNLSHLELKLKTAYCCIDEYKHLELIIKKLLFDYRIFLLLIPFGGILTIVGVAKKLASSPII